jgi:hypothetical protein
MLANLVVYPKVLSFSENSFFLIFFGFFFRRAELNKSGLGEMG